VSERNARSRKRREPRVDHIEYRFPTPSKKKGQNTEPYHRYVHEPDAHDRGFERLTKHAISDEFKGDGFWHIRRVDFGEGVGMLAYVTFGPLRCVQPTLETVKRKRNRQPQHLTVMNRWGCEKNHYLHLL